MMHTTFNLLKKAGACGQQPGSGHGYDKLAKALGGTTKYGKDTPIPLVKIVESNGLADALWCLRAVLPHEEQLRDALARNLACDYAERVLPIWEAKHPTDLRPRQTIETARRFVAGKATAGELMEARRNAYAAYAAAAYAAYAADYAAAAAYAAYAADYAAYAAYAAAYAAYAAAYAAAYVGGSKAERQWQAARFLEVLASDLHWKGHTGLEVK
jgi:hypothetical protein